MSIDAKLVAELRSMTGAGMMDAKKALEESTGDLEKAAQFLREKGMAKAAKKSSRETNEGRVHAYIHSNGKLGAMVEILCETDFVARNEAFIAFCNDVAMHVSALEPLYLTREEVPLELVEKEKEIFTKEMENQAKPAEVIEKIVEGKLSKWYSEIVLLEQAFIKDEDMTIDEFVKSKIASIGENITIRRFARFNI
ncbi:translation elongation factor Ts [Candidatus Uhrbacteria bacterium CG10_big_fil_rev_8_21_14_0_10_48_16]|uniref:Elongation factor Ts n=1 Tax=Candidatus Uhrbacteria bacterium CG10_big_fil_rev_8_21_14_0_10_48_16 TaxID=1975038 RepID=A0A2M8LH47_9BACT|nr:MAG: translation elongation factor Ts [Candidatus Uhrbacteria bacterium CG10_big_fil_rev_8_21_14_0_10_48_16]